MSQRQMLLLWDFPFKPGEIGRLERSEPKVIPHKVQIFVTDTGCSRCHFPLRITWFFEDKSIFDAIEASVRICDICRIGYIFSRNGLELFSKQIVVEPP